MMAFLYYFMLPIFTGRLRCCRSLSEVAKAARGHGAHWVTVWVSEWLSDTRAGPRVRARVAAVTRDPTLTDNASCATELLRRRRVLLSNTSFLLLLLLECPLKDLSPAPDWPTLFLFFCSSSSFPSTLGVYTPFTVPFVLVQRHSRVTPQEPMGTPGPSHGLVTSQEVGLSLCTMPSGQKFIF